MATTLQRQKLATAMDLLHRERARVHYRQRRPMQTRWVRSMTQLRQTLYDGNGVTMDCSEAVTTLCHIAGLRDPNGFGYDGWGSTWTLLTHLPHYTDPSKARIGALVVYGPGGGDHVSMVRWPGKNPILWSHGQESGPSYISLATQRRYHRRPVTFLSIAHL